MGPNLCSLFGNEVKTQNDGQSQKKKNKKNFKLRMFKFYYCDSTNTTQRYYVTVHVAKYMSATLVQNAVIMTI